LLEAVGLLATAPVTIALENELLALPPLPERDREVVLGHPRLKRLELSHRAAEHAVRVEVAKQYPELWIGPDYEYDQGLNTLGFGLMLEIPIFDRNRGGIAAAESGRTAAREQYQAEVLRLSRKEAAARARRKASLEILQQYRSETLQAVERAEQVIAGRLRGGESNILELLEARRAVARARLQAVSLSERVDIATLKAAYAGGWVLPRAPEGDTES
jgi:CRISPR system Cascade subunit CasA